MSAILKQKLIDIANGFTKYGLWKGGGSGNLSELDDVTLTNLQTNDVLTYNGSKWVNDDNLQKQIDTLNSNFSESFCKTFTHNITFNDGSFNLSYDLSRIFSKIYNVYVTEYGGYNIFGCGIVDDSLSNYTIGIKCITNPSTNSNYDLKVTYIGEVKKLL